jgi:DNA repair protein RecO
MSYETYTTEALVCGTFDRNTADRSFLLFTREAGMLYADARSVREERSRQRYALQNFSLLRVSLVKGKHSWKIGSIEPIKNYYHEAVNKAARGSIVTICRLMRRFVKGEEVNPKLYDHVIATLEVLRQDHTRRSFVEMVTAVQILGQLGYVDVSKLPSQLSGLAPEEIAKHHTEAVHKQAERLYTHAISVSHL